mgnify:CR=1 FL=1
MEYKFIEGIDESNDPQTIVVNLSNEKSVENLFLSISNIGKESIKKNIKINVDSIYFKNEQIFLLVNLLKILFILDFSIIQ